MRELRPAPLAHHHQTLRDPPAPAVPTQHLTAPKTAISSFQNHQYTHNASKSHNSPSQYEYPISPKCEHVVQFYDSDSFLYDSISSFLLTSFFSSQEAAVVFATTSHILALEHQLFHQHCLFPEVMKRRGQLVVYEADGVLESILGKGLSQDSFEAFIVPIVCKLREKGYARILIYGELVNLLCEDGRYWDAVKLEKIWNVFLQGPIGTEYGVELLCGYKMDVFALDEADLEHEMNGIGNGRPNGEFNADVQVAAFREICKTHSDVRPTEKAAGEFGGGNPRRIHSGESYHGSAKAVDIPRTLVSEQPIGKDQGGMMIAVLQHRIRMLEKQVLRVEETSRKDREFRKLFNKLPVGIYASYVAAEKADQSPKSGERGKAILVPKGKGKRQSPPIRAEQAPKTQPIMNSTFTNLLGLEDVAISSSNMTTVTSAHRKWIDTFVHPDDREGLVASIENVGLGAALREDHEEGDGAHRSKCTYRIIRPDGQVKWLLGETVGEMMESGNADGSAEARERKYIHSMTDLTDMMGKLRMFPTAGEAEGQATCTISSPASVDTRNRIEYGNSGYKSIRGREPVTAVHSGSHKRRATEHSPHPNPSNRDCPHDNPHKHHQTQHFQHCVGLDLLNLAVPPPEFFQERELDRLRGSTAGSTSSQPSMCSPGAPPTYGHQQYHPYAPRHQHHGQFFGGPNHLEAVPEAWGSDGVSKTPDRRNSSTSTKSTNTTKSRNSAAGRSSATGGRVRTNHGRSSAASTPSEGERRQQPGPAAAPRRQQHPSPSNRD